MAHGKVYSAEFKKEVIEYAKACKTMNELAEFYKGVPRATLYSWITYADSPDIIFQRKKSKAVKGIKASVTKTPVENSYHKIVVPDPSPTKEANKKIVLICSDDSTQILSILKGMIDG